MALRPHGTLLVDELNYLLAIAPAPLDGQHAIEKMPMRWSCATCMRTFVCLQAAIGIPGLAVRKTRLAPLRAKLAAQDGPLGISQQYP
jgi:hypothetical protein